MVLLFMGYNASSTLFVHTHDIGGREVSHSHPYIPSSHHSHSAFGFQLINIISHAPLAIFAAEIILGCGVFAFFVKTSVTERIKSFYLLGVSALRAPPVLG